MPTNTTDRLAKLRVLLAEHKLDAYIVPSEDAHHSEYIADCDSRRAFISGFTGSAGIAVVTADKAALWTDGRYFLPASQQLDSNWILQKMGLSDTLTKEQWIVAEFAAAGKTGGRVGLDPVVVAVTPADTLREALTAKGHEMVAVRANLVDAVWGSDRPARPSNPVAVLADSFAGRSSTVKLAEVREWLAKPVKDGDKDVAAHALVLTALDDLAWLFNLRGSDIAFNPVFFAYAVITRDDATLYIDAAKLSPDVLSHLAAGPVNVKPYAAIFDDVAAAAMTVAESGRKFIIDGRCNLALVDAIGKNLVHVVARNPVVLTKAVKNPTEVAGFHASHIRDAAALVSYFAWLEDQLVTKGRTDIDEVDGSDYLAAQRAKGDHFMGLSFGTISASGPNGAINHYSPKKGSCRTIDPAAMYLCDSGGQYMDGTTDVTRTIHLKGTPTAFEKLANTRVLQGHVQLALATFPKGTSGYVVDAFARGPLWSSGLDFRHGTGHGVGHFLNVHEGPHSISARPTSLDVALAPGMIVTNEPGYYQDAPAGDQPAFGTRIENVLVVVEKQTPYNFGGVGHLGFENATVVPYDKSLIEVSLLTPAEIKYVDSYHQECWSKVSPYLAEDSLEWNWLKRATSPFVAA
ncbi:putative Xaa-Pro aminopeptidase P [Blastocladiella britannica]|nr:putative Xaa-Pro aminopeptidase P [Blastocladiella britannica]